MKSFCLVVIALFGCTSLSPRLFGQAAASIKSPFPEPFRVLQDEKKFNAVEFGPGNTIEIRQAPKDFELEDIALSSKGEFLAIVWGSGRTEIWRVSDGSKIKEFKASTWGAAFTEDDSLLISHGHDGEVLISDVKTGKVVRKLKAELGPRKYDVRSVLYRPQGDWWAYVDGEEGRAIKLSDGKTVLATFGNATDFALSPDGKKIWTVGRDAVRVYSVGSWSLEKEWKLRSLTPPTSEPEFAMGKTAKGIDFVAVPSVDGLMMYPEDAQEGIVARGAAFIDSGEDLMLVGGPTMQLMSLNGKLRCEWQQYPHHRSTASVDGKWIAIADFQRVSVWKMVGLADGCK
jgi:WD40-like Beta Propeller Repeat